jgi:hypothetical protein
MVFGPGSPPAGVQDGEPYDLLTLIPNDHIVIGEIAVRSVTRLLEVNVQGVGLAVIGRIPAGETVVILSAALPALPAGRQAAGREESRAALPASRQGRISPFDEALRRACP